MCNSDVEEALRYLLHTHGFEVQDRWIMCQAVMAWAECTDGQSTPSVLGSCRNLPDACDQISRVIRDKEFSDRFRSIIAQQQE